MIIDDTSSNTFSFMYKHTLLYDCTGANQLLMGLDSIVACIFEFGAFFIVEHVIKYVGHIGILYIGLFAYIIRFVVYAALVNPWFVLPVEALQGKLSLNLLSLRS